MDVSIFDSMFITNPFHLISIRDFLSFFSYSFFFPPLHSCVQNPHFHSGYTLICPVWSHKLQNLNFLLSKEFFSIRNWNFPNTFVSIKKNIRFSLTVSPFTFIIAETYVHSCKAFRFSQALSRNFKWVKAEHIEGNTIQRKWRFDFRYEFRKRFDGK